MNIIESMSALEDEYAGAVVTVGNYDGLHIGHQQILQAAKEIAQKKAAQLLVMTFEPHPVRILHPEKAPKILTPRLLKQKLLESFGVDCWLILRTTADILSLSAPEFVEKFLVEPIAPCAVVEGEDFNFGSDRAGNVELLQRLGSVNGFEVTVVSARTIELEQIIRVSSTMIRYMLEGGEVEDAAAGFGRPYRLIGKIVAGRGKGKELGFPTLNMERPDQLIPAEGVYAGFVSITPSYESVCTADDKIPAVFSIGQARTFGDEHPTLIEAHLLNEPESDPEGEYMAMDFIGHIRQQHKFASLNELSNQIARDCDKAKRILEMN
jgi:riboflavin kinase/FMN adenylyltransferase